MRRLPPFCLALFLLLPAALAPPAAALESGAVASPRATVTLVSDRDSLGPDGRLRLALRFRLAPGWHTYWRNPGDAGTAATLTLTLPAGATAGEIAWPVPRRLPEGPLMTFGYTDEVLLAVPVTVAAPAGGLRVEAEASWLVCERVCVPEEGRFGLDLPAGDGAPSAEASLFDAAEARLPVPSPFAAQVAPDGTLAVTGEGLSAATVREAWFLPGEPDALRNAAPQTLRPGDGGLALALPTGPAFRADAPLEGVLVLRDAAGGERALAVTATPGGVPSGVPGVASGTESAGAARGAGPEGAPGYLRVLGLALLGGLLLNLMPCVFPVLAMKAVAIARLSGAARGEVRAHAASYTAGVLLAFAGLGGLLLALRAGGAAAGWGFQFQSPLFVAAMAWLLFALGLNLSGAYAIGWRLAGAGQGLAGRGGHLGSFATGLLAVLVATPCTAPFMATAVAASLAMPAAATLGVFLALGLGLAAPYALLALLPRLAGMLPRPGPWMEVLRQGLAFPMYGAAIWLVWVIAQQGGPDAALAVLCGMALLGFAAWVLGVAARGRGAWRRVGQGAALLAGLGLLGLGGAVAAGGDAAPAARVAADEASEPFSAARLRALRAEGRPVFVNMTAAWCVTCLVNERIALAPAAVRAAFARGHVAYLKGDWTRQDPEITAFLRAHGRDGVPLYVFYPPGGEPVVLPQLLTEATVLGRLGQRDEARDEARGGARGG
ncbi:thioredoxin family protein [Roseomonas sp. NAR14]|uniref:Thioredoxin family protein n=1 Tax=Roseomonas acroporae TaxID=2937791 RepID=A0A9X1Y507_9PROT|nr:protein-disulfide reductase DsbD domain-containing protein [Roseomonas acroporae]MCK8783190.1 thioredoxin family protein [Roseomonas acroporae]